MRIMVKPHPAVMPLIDAGIARLVVAVQDPDHRVNGSGFDQMAAADIKILLGVMQSEAEETLSGFINKVQLQ